MNFSKTRLLIFFFLECIVFGVGAKNRPSGEPYVSGDTFRKYCQFVLDEDSDFSPKLVKCGDIIFVYSGWLDKFFAHYHPYIRHPYILVTHNEDYPVPGRFKNFLLDNKIFAWFAMNADVINNQKLIPIPIGITNTHWKGREAYWLLLKNAQSMLPVEKNILLYCNFLINTNKAIRGPVYNFFRQQEFVVCDEPGLSYAKYFERVSHSKFILSPEGTGLDCHRTWEALYLGSFPIVKTSTLDPLFIDLPVVIVNDWKEITRDFLERTYQEMMHRTYATEKIYINYWLELIREYQIKCRTKRAAEAR